MNISDDALIRWLRDRAASTVTASGSRATFVSDAYFEIADRLEKRLWQPMRTAPKDGTPILAVFRDGLESISLEHMRWNGRQVVIRHGGVAEDRFDYGWSFAAPVGHTGFPDGWFAGWMSLPEPPEA